MKRDPIEAIVKLEAEHIYYLRAAGWIPEVFPSTSKDKQALILFCDPKDGTRFELDNAVQIQVSRDRSDIAAEKRNSK